MALRTNLLYDGTATPNLGIDFALGQHGSIGASIGLKPWPRWLAWDYDNAVPAKWRHRLVTLEGRWWPKRVYDGWFLGADALYLHYNFASLHLPFGLYPVLNNSRLQGDAVGAGLFAGYSWWLGEHWRLELAAGVAGAYNNADRYECDHCSAKVGTEQGAVIIPQLALNIAWDSKRRTAKRQQVLDAIGRIEAEAVLEEQKSATEAIPEQYGGGSGATKQSSPDKPRITSRRPLPKQRRNPSPSPCRHPPGSAIRCCARWPNTSLTPRTWPCAATGTLRPSSSNSMTRACCAKCRPARACTTTCPASTPSWT